MYAEFADTTMHDIATNYGGSKRMPVAVWREKKEKFRQQCAMLEAAPPQQTIPFEANAPGSPSGARMKLARFYEQDFDGPDEWRRVQLLADRVLMVKAPSAIHGEGMFATEDISKQQKTLNAELGEPEEHAFKSLFHFG